MSSRAGTSGRSLLLKLVRSRRLARLCCPVHRVLATFRVKVRGQLLLGARHARDRDWTVIRAAAAHALLSLIIATTARSEWGSSAECASRHSALWLLPGATSVRGRGTRCPGTHRRRRRARLMKTPLAQGPYDPDAWYATTDGANIINGCACAHATPRQQHQRERRSTHTVSGPCHLAFSGPRCSPLTIICGATVSLHTAEPCIVVASIY